MIARAPYPQSIDFANIVGAPIVVTRPNNVTAYAAGQVMGAAVDARITVPVPALPVGATTPGFATVGLHIINNRPVSDPTLALSVLMFSALPATVLADQAALDLSDPDIALLFSHASTSFPPLANSFNTGAGQASQLNHSAFPNGRRKMTLSTSPSDPHYIVPRGILGLYFFAGAAYVPAALETLTVVPYFRYQGLAFPSRL